MATQTPSHTWKDLVSEFWGVPEIRGLGSLGFLRYSTKALGLGRLILITRWLSPADMGSYGLALLILAVTEVVTETGVNIALLKHPDRLKKYIHTAWAVSILRGTVIAVLMMILAPVLSRFFAVTQLTNLLVWCALIALLKGFINPAIVTFHQNLQFGRETLYRVPLQLVDLGVGLVMSWWWGSAAGLLVGILAGATVEVLSSFVIFKQWPNLLLARWQDLVSLYRETRVIVANGIVSYLNEHADDILIGRLLGPVALGFYQTGYKLVSSVTIDVANIGGAALYPILAQRHNNSKEFRATYLRAVVGLVVVLLSVAVIFVGFADLVVQTLFAAEWQPVAQLLPWLFVAAAAKSLMLIGNSVAILTKTLRWHLLGNIVIVVLMLTGIYFFGQHLGILGASMAVAGAMLSVQPVLWLVTWRSLKNV